MRKNPTLLILFIFCLMFLMTSCTPEVSNPEPEVETSPAPEASNPEPEVETSPRVGYLAPDFQLASSDGSQIALKDLRGKAVFITFWDTSCLYCRYEMPRLQALHKKYSDQGLVVLGINMKDSLEEVLEYARTLHVEFPMLLDSDEKVARAYWVIDRPHAFFIDENGIITNVHIGELSTAAMEEQVQLVLK